MARRKGHVDVIHKVKVWSKTRMLELLAKHLGLDEVAREGEAQRVPLFQLPNNSRGSAIRLAVLNAKALPAPGTSPTEPRVG